MHVKTISAVYERKFNLGDFNSMTVGATAWADLDENEDSVAAYAALFTEVKEVVKEQSLPVVQKLKAKVQEVFAGLPVNKGEAEKEGSALLDRYLERDRRESGNEAGSRRSKAQEEASDDMASDTEINRGDVGY